MTERPDAGCLPSRERRLLAGLIVLFCTQMVAGVLSHVYNPDVALVLSHAQEQPNAPADRVDDPESPWGEDRDDFNFNSRFMLSATAPVDLARSCLLPVRPLALPFDLLRPPISRP
jgi:hypothetical protein